MRRAMQGMGRMAVLAAAVAVLPAGLAAQAAEASDDNDRAAHAFVSAVDLGEVQQSMLATQRATNAEVRAYAQQMITDHAGALHTREMLMQTERSGLLPRMNHDANGAGGNARAQAAQTVSGPGVAGAGVSSQDIEARGTAQGSTGQTNSAQGTSSTQGTGGPVSMATGGPGIPGQGVATQDIEGRGNAQGNAGHQAAGHGAHAAHSGMAAHGSVTPEMVAQLESVLQAHPMSRPVMASNAQNLQVLQGINGPQFDASYMDAQIGAHRYALTNIDRMLQQGGLGSDMTGALRMMRTAVASHLEKAQQIRARLGS